MSEPHRITLIGGPMNGKRVLHPERTDAPYRILISENFPVRMGPPWEMRQTPIRCHVYRPQAIDVKGEIVIVWAYDGVEGGTR